MVRYTKESIEKAIKDSLNKREVLEKLGAKGKISNYYGTLNKYIKLFEIDDSSLKPHVKTFPINKERKYKKGDKHPTDNLLFWQYRYERVNKKGYEQWLTPEQYLIWNEKHSKNNKKYRQSDVLATITRNALARTKNKFKNDIDIQYIKSLWEKQEGLCYWFKIPMLLKIEEFGISNPMKVSIDRIDSKKGYIKGNVVLCTWFANRGKGSASEDDWKNILDKIRNAVF